LREIDTPAGLARAELQLAGEPAGALVLGHGAGGGIGARDLAAAAEAAAAAGFSVALVEQPYRAAGRRSPAAARQLDAAWVAAVEALGAEELAGLPLVVGGRSAGARVACRTAAQTGAAAVLCLAFPLMPPRRGRAQGVPAASRQPELDAVTVPTLVVQGASDPFGVPRAGPQRRVVVVPGNHSLTSDLDGVRAEVRDWLGQLGPWDTTNARAGARPVS
jgi:predicted alpha/beta-hydrolase family hydrolase